ncbi:MULTISPECIES: Flp family type IVb pilin [unclassified Pseudomonas]|jgi:pilus assembly protein Flp/PilA|uniref:Flp family type IVb pilin n=1 Tax=unclassified Pseudomonas TaxID=196821 RepID=UPI0015B1383B|nr:MULTISPECIES: Flp family type IVb pilin [unclassified Pseudomonas]
MLGLNLDYVIARARAFARSEEGASAIEYAIVVAMVAVVVVAFITPIGERILAIFDSILNALPAATP